VLASVVDEKLGNGKYKIPNYSVAAKTGTAQIPKPGGGYYDDRYLHSFVGYVPAYDPKYIILLMNVEPQGAEYASETLSDPFMDIVHFLINYYNIKPDR
jgi:cell division protein FtsI/penicillin-binding protein 2